MKIALIVGTRPEIIKMSPIIRYCQVQKINFFIIHSGQHYDYEMDKIFFEELKLPQAKYDLKVGSLSSVTQTAQILKKTEPILLREKPDLVLVQGDTNTTLAASLAAAKLQVKLAHIEAGVRSYDKSMPEEINRILVDHLSDFLFVPTIDDKNNALKENISSDKIFVTGNTIVDAVLENLKLITKTHRILEKLGLKKQSYILLTLHREVNTDNKKRLKSIFKGLKMVAKDLSLKIIWPLHPRTRKMVRKFKLRIPKEIKLLKPLGFFDFLRLEKEARLILTDSGGVQEEACILRVPCVTLRENTELPQTLVIGGNILAGVDPKKIVIFSKTMLNKRHKWRNPFGRGNAAKKIIDILCTAINTYDQ